MAKKPPKFEALVVNAIRRLQAAQGSTETEIASYLNQEYNVQGPEVRKQIQLTLKRGMNYGILQKSKRGFVTCDRNIPDVLDVADCSHRRGSRRRGRSTKRKSARRGRSRSKKRRPKRGGCSTCPRRRAVTTGIKNRGIRTRAAVRTKPKVKRMTNKRPTNATTRANREKTKKTSNEEKPTNRQPTANHSKSNSKSPREPRKKGDDNNNNNSQS